jgi:hypothetical protein
MQHLIDIDDKLRRIIYESYSGKCQYCTEDRKIPFEQAQIDHIIPKAVSNSNLETVIDLVEWTNSASSSAFDRAELNSVFNYTLACQHHNGKKHAKLLPIPALGFLLMNAKEKAEGVVAGYNNGKKKKKKKKVKLDPQTRKIMKFLDDMQTFQIGSASSTFIDVKNVRKISKFRYDFFYKDVGVTVFTPEQIEIDEDLLLESFRKHVDDYNPILVAVTPSYKIVNGGPVFRDGKFIKYELMGSHYGVRLTSLHGESLSLEEACREEGYDSEEFREPTKKEKELFYYEFLRTDVQLRQSAIETYFVELAKIENPEWEDWNYGGVVIHEARMGSASVDITKDVKLSDGRFHPVKTWVGTQYLMIPATVLNNTKGEKAKVEQCISQGQTKAILNHVDAKDQHIWNMGNIQASVGEVVELDDVVLMYNLREFPGIKRNLNINPSELVSYAENYKNNWKIARPIAVGAKQGAREGVMCGDPNDDFEEILRRRGYNPSMWRPPTTAEVEEYVVNETKSDSQLFFEGVKYYLDKEIKNKFPEIGGGQILQAHSPDVTLMQFKYEGKNLVEGKMLDLDSMLFPSHLVKELFVREI